MDPLKVDLNYGMAKLPEEEEVQEGYTLTVTNQSSGPQPITYASLVADDGRQFVYGVANPDVIPNPRFPFDLPAGKRMEFLILKRGVHTAMQQNGGALPTKYRARFMSNGTKYESVEVEALA